MEYIHTDTYTVFYVLQRIWCFLAICVPEVRPMLYVLRWGRPICRE